MLIDPVTVSDKVHCIRRELAFRQKVYPGRVRAGKMEPEEMEREIRVMQCILRDYERLAGIDEQGNLF